MHARVSAWLPNLLVEQHPDQQSQRVVREKVVGGGVSGDVKGHASSVSGQAHVRHRGSGCQFRCELVIEARLRPTCVPEVCEGGAAPVIERR